jgi:hypothetical protein
MRHLANTFPRQVVHSKQIIHNDGGEDVYIHSVAYLEFFEGWAVFQVPAVCHLFQGFDLHPLSDVPIILHSRELVSWQTCPSRCVSAVISARCALVVRHTFVAHLY